jgi:hypothetical protein
MTSGPRNTGVRTDGRRWALAFAITCTVVFGLGVLIGYNSIYRDISVAMLTPQVVSPPL